MIVRALKGLESIIDLYQVHFDMGPEGWYFSGEGDSLPEDPLHGFKKLKELYFHADPNYDGRFTVPLLWDKKKDVPVNNESSEIIRMFASEFDDLLPEELREVNRPGGGLYPEDRRQEIDEINDWVYNTVNNGVYKVGFAKTQESYDTNVTSLFTSLDRLETLLQNKRYLLGDTLTLADIRLYTTIARFDLAYFSVFMCNLKTIRYDYPALYLWFRRLYWDQDTAGEFRAAFWKTTKPYIGGYTRGYADARRRIVLGEDAPLIVPVGFKVVVDPLE